MNKKQQMKQDLKTLIDDYKSSKELDFIFNKDTDKFDITQFPDIIQKMVTLVTTKASSFSNISALGITLYVLADLFGQLRPKINATVYSEDILLINFYGIVLAASGRGKDSSYRALLKASDKASKYIQKLKEDEAVEKAKKIFIKTAKQADPDFDVSTVVYDDYADLAQKFIDEIEPTTADIKSSRGGLASAMNRMATSKYGTKSIFSSELTMAIESSPFVPEVLELLAQLYDMARADQSSFKSEDAKEKAINGISPNLLAVTNANSFFQDGPTRTVLVSKLKGAYLRRAFIIFSDTTEEFQNISIAKSVAEKKTKQAHDRKLTYNLSEEINEQLLKAVQSTATDNIVSFDEQAESLYDAYSGYNETYSMLLSLDDPDNTKATEVAGKAFKMGRIAALFALAQNKRVVDYNTLKAAIIFADNCSTHSERLMEVLSLKKYQLMIRHYRDGVFGNKLSLTDSINRGYITTKEVNKNSIANLLNLLNSDMEGECVVSYDETSRQFIFTKLVKNTENTYNFRAMKGHIEDKPVPKELLNKDMSIFSKLLITDSSINPFIEDKTKVVILTVDKSVISMDKLNHYLANIQHWVATKKDTTDERAFTIILPVNLLIDKSDYKFVSMAIANQLLLKVAAETCEPDYIHHGYDGAIQLTSNDGANLFDISGILSNAATTNVVPKLITKTATKPTKSSIDKYLNQEILDNFDTIIDVVNISKTPLLFLASLCYDMVCHHVPTEQIISTITDVNNSINKSFQQNDIDVFVIEPFIIE